jgi:hypothetical protein
MHVAILPVRRDNTLASLLHEAFKLLELRFQTYDHDRAGQPLPSPSVWFLRYRSSYSSRAPFPRARKHFQPPKFDKFQHYGMASRHASICVGLHSLSPTLARAPISSAETLMYKELEGQLALVGFNDQEKLEALFRRVDLDSNGTLDFRLLRVGPRTRLRSYESWSCHVCGLRRPMPSCPN